MQKPNWEYFYNQFFSSINKQPTSNLLDGYNKKIVFPKSGAKKMKIID
jgi:hypothetical protein